MVGLGTTRRERLMGSQATRRGGGFAGSGAGAFVEWLAGLLTLTLTANPGRHAR